MKISAVWGAVIFLMVLSLMSCSTPAPKVTQRRPASGTIVPTPQYGVLVPYVPANGSAEAEVLDVYAPAGEEELGDKYNKGTITKAELKRLAAMVKENHFERIGKAHIQFVAAKDGEIVLTGLPGRYSHVSYDPQTQTMNTPFGVLNGPIHLRVELDTQPFGPWTGWQWRGTQLNPDTSEPLVSFEIGRSDDKRTNIIFYEVKVMNQGKLVKFYYYLLYK